MKQVFKKLAPSLVFILYALIAGGSVEDVGLFLLIIISIIVVIAILFLVGALINEWIKKKEILSEAVSSFGKYSISIWLKSKRQYVLYDTDTNRMYFDKSIYNTNSFRELKTGFEAAKVALSYKEESVTKTSTGSAIGRGVAGALIAGPVGAIVGGSTAKRVTETKKTPVLNTIGSDTYSLSVIDNAGKTKISIVTTEKKDYERLKNLLDSIIGNNTKEEKAERKKEEDKKLQLISTSTITTFKAGISVEEIGQILLNSKKSKGKDGIEKHTLCKESVEVVGKTINTTCDSVVIGVDSKNIMSIKCKSSKYNTNSFDNLLSEMNKVKEIVNSYIGKAIENDQQISYWLFTEDNKKINAYSWIEECCNSKIDVYYEQGQYFFIYNSEYIPKEIEIKKNEEQIDDDTEEIEEETTHVFNFDPQGLYDPEFKNVARYVVLYQECSIQFIKKHFKTFSEGRCDRLIDQLQDVGIVGKINKKGIRPVYVHDEVQLDRIFKE